MTPEENSPDEKVRYWMLRSQEAERAFLLMKEIQRAFEDLVSHPPSILKPPYIYGDAPLYSSTNYPSKQDLTWTTQTGNAVMRPDDGKTDTP